MTIDEALIEAIKGKKVCGVDWDKNDKEFVYFKNGKFRLSNGFNYDDTFELYSEFKLDKWTIYKPVYGKIIDKLQELYNKYDKNLDNFVLYINNYKDLTGDEETIIDILETDYCMLDVIKTDCIQEGEFIIVPKSPINDVNTEPKCGLCSTCTHRIGTPYKPLNLISHDYVLKCEINGDFGYCAVECSDYKKQ